MSVLAHIGKVPVEEWVPFVVPVVALFIYGRRKDRRRRDAVSRLPDAAEPLDDATVAQVEAKWSETNHADVARRHLALLYPPGPDGMSAQELASRIHCDEPTVERLLEELEELDYVELEARDGFEGRRAWLTFKGYELVDATESALLSAHGAES